MVDQRLLQYLEGFITPQRRVRFLEILKERTNYITVAIEDVYQIHNTSAVVRSCDVFGVQQVHVIESKFGERLDKEIAMGAQKWVDLKRYKCTKDCIETLRKQGYRIVATTPHENNCSLSNFKFSGKMALFFGTERDGLSKEVLEKADVFLKIPMVGFTESLNISVSAAIILHSLTNQLRNEKIAWELTDAEKMEKRLDWTKKSIRSLEDILARYYSSR